MRMSIGLLGCGNVGQALIRLLAEKAGALRAEHQLEIAVTGGFTRHAGGWLSQPGLSAAVLAASGWPHGAIPAGAVPFTGESVAFARLCPADVLVELTTLQPETGQPALDHVRLALASGKHVVTANKGPIAHAYHELRGLADQHGVRLRFESTVMDGTPIFNMAEASLPVTTVTAIVGILNSTSNYILSRMVDGEPLDGALAEAQRLGIAEANPAYDLEGWDASVKATVLANVLMGADLRPQAVRRIGLGADAMRETLAKLPEGHTVRQSVTVTREDGEVVATVTLATVPHRDIFASVAAGEVAICLHTDTMGKLTIVEGAGGPEQTAHGVLADLVAIARSVCL